MSYQVLARKWRPKTFADVVGQTHILTALSNGLRENRLHHAYLFSGTRGVGKTSIARLFAKGLNCQQGITADPCGVCEHCKAIENGHFIDLIEIDAASRTKVEDTRELLDNVQYKPVQGRYKVYLIDEVHMLSRHSFNALLKTLEEPPEYVKFLLATTDPQKLPITILSRCMQFHLKALEQIEISQQLDKILTKENIPFEPLALDKLAKAAQGSLRDSLSLTDQAIAMSNSHITLDIVSRMLGLLDDQQPIEILYALQQGNGEALMKTVQAVSMRGGDWEVLLNSVAELLHQISMQQLLPSASTEENNHIHFLAQHISPEDVQFFYQIIVTGRKELSFAPTARIGAEMTLLRALAFHPKLTTAFPLVREGTENNTSSSTLVNMPVVSQTIKATYQGKQNTANRDNPASHSAQAASGLSSSSLGVLNALAQLDAASTSPLDSVEQEKKNSDGIRNTARQTSASASALVPDHSDYVSIPVVEPPLPQQATQKLASVHPAQNKSPQNSPHFATKMPQIMNLPEENGEENNDENSEENGKENLDENLTDVNLAENYRWQWLNPEMAKEVEAIKPSDIKKAILQENTPELQQRIVATARQQDFWTDLIERLAISGLVKEMAINCSVLEQNEHEIKLGLLDHYAHLHKPKTVQALQKALAEHHPEMHLQVILTRKLEQATPVEIRHQIYRQFSEQAKQDLQQDTQIQLLNKEFGAMLDLGSIRPV